MYRLMKANSQSEITSLTKEDILYNLKLLDDKLRENDMTGEVDLYGGAVMCLGLNARQSTHDVDAIFAPKSDIRQLIEEVAIENNLPLDWMNDSVKGFVSSKGKFIPLEATEFTNLTVCMTDPSYLFAMKCLSCRLEYENDTEISDIKFLADYLGIDNVDKAEQLILQYYPANRYKPKTHFMLMELFGSK